MYEDISELLNTPTIDNLKRAKEILEHNLIECSILDTKYKRLITTLEKKKITSKSKTENLANNFVDTEPVITKQNPDYNCYLDLVKIRNLDILNQLLSKLNNPEKVEVVEYVIAYIMSEITCYYSLLDGEKDKEYIYKEIDFLEQLIEILSTEYLSEVEKSETDTELKNRIIFLPSKLDIQNSPVIDEIKKMDRTYLNSVFRMLEELKTINLYKGLGKNTKKLINNGNYDKIYEQKNGASLIRMIIRFVDSKTILILNVFIKKSHCFNNSVTDSICARIKSIPPDHELLSPESIKEQQKSLDELIDWLNVNKLTGGFNR